MKKRDFIIMAIVAFFVMAGSPPAVAQQGDDEEVVEQALAPEATNDVTPPQELKGFLPETLAGVPQHGEMVARTQETEDGKKWSAVSQNYASGDRSGSIIIITSNGIIPSLETLNSVLDIQVDNDEIHWNLTTVKGFKVFEQYDKKTREATITVLYNDGNGVEIKISNTEDTKPLIQCAESMDLDGLASLIKLRTD